MRDGLGKSLLNTVRGLNRCGLIDDAKLRLYQKDLDDPQYENFEGSISCKANELIFLCSDDGV